MSRRRQQDVFLMLALSVVLAFAWAGICALAALPRNAYREWSDDQRPKDQL